jgi:hypothetical protein
MGARGPQLPRSIWPRPGSQGGGGVDTVEALIVLSNMRAHSGLYVDELLSIRPLSVENPQLCRFRAVRGRE